MNVFCQIILAIFFLGISVVCIISFFKTYSKINKKEDGKKYEEWTKEYKNLIIKITFAITLLCVAFLLFFNFVYYISYNTNSINFLKFKSEFKDYESFTIIISSLTLFSTFGIAAIQIVNLKGERILNEKHNFDLEQDDFEKKVNQVIMQIDENVVLYNFLYSDLKTCFACEIYNKLIDKTKLNEIDFVLQFNSFSRFNLERFTISNIGISYDDNHVNKNLIINREIYNNSLYIIVKENDPENVIRSKLIEFIKLGMSSFWIELDIENEKNKNISPTTKRIFLDFQSLRSQQPLVMTDGICQLVISNVI